MIFLIDPQDAQSSRCRPVFPSCKTFCGIKPLYGIDI